MPRSRSSRAVCAGLRPYDLLGRFGGEEFSVFLQAEPAEAFQIAERLRASLAAQPIASRHTARPLHVTVSIGVAATKDPASCTLTGLLATADTALRRAKTGGRDAVRLSGDPVAERAIYLG
jgi:diguanylate cyclase (GGDEF)-like protein